MMPSRRGKRRRRNKGRARPRFGGPGCCVLLFAECSEETARALFRRLKAGGAQVQTRRARPGDQFGLDPRGAPIVHIATTAGEVPGLVALRGVLLNYRPGL